MRFLVGMAVASIMMVGESRAEMETFTPPGMNTGTICGDRSEMVRALHDQFREEPQAVGQVNENAVIEVFVSHTGTWTILATGTDGKSCMVAAGEGWDTANLVIGTDL